MKKQLIILSLALLPIIGIAQNNDNENSLPADTTVVIKGRKYVIHEAEKKLNIKVYGKTQRGDTIKDDMIYEATFNDEQTTERRFEFSMPFQKKTYHKRHYAAFLTGIYMGYSQLNNDFGFAGSDAADLKASRSWELGIGITKSHFQLDNEGHWSFTTGLDWGYRSFRLQGNYVFRMNNNITNIEAGTDSYVYAVSRLRYNFLRLPIMLNWKTRIGRNLYISAGLEPEWRYSIKSKAKVNGRDETIDSDLNVNPIGLNMVAEARYGNIGFYGRCGMTKLFESNKGPKMYPSSFGIIWHW